MGAANVRSPLTRKPDPGIQSKRAARELNEEVAPSQSLAAPTASFQSGQGPTPSSDSQPPHLLQDLLASHTNTNMSDTEYIDNERDGVSHEDKKPDVKSSPSPRGKKRKPVNEKSMTTALVHPRRASESPRPEMVSGRRVRRPRAEPATKLQNHQADACPIHRLPVA